MHWLLHMAALVATVPAVDALPEGWTRLDYVDEQSWGALFTYDHMWLRATHQDDPSLSVLLRLTATAAGESATTALLFLRDGKAVSARDLRALPIAPLMEYGKQLAPWFETAPEVRVRPARPGPKGHPPEHWLAVWELYQQAKAAGVRNHIQWMRAKWDDPVPDATMRRWKDRAEALYGSKTTAADAPWDPQHDQAWQRFDELKTPKRKRKAR